MNSMRCTSLDILQMAQMFVAQSHQALEYSQQALHLYGASRWRHTTVIANSSYYIKM